MLSGHEVDRQQRPSMLDHLGHAVGVAPRLRGAQHGDAAHADLQLHDRGRRPGHHWDPGARALCPRSPHQSFPPGAQELAVDEEVFRSAVHPNAENGEFRGGAPARFERGALSRVERYLWEA